jgi:hypothetical protein
MPITAAVWIADPNHEIRVLVTITMRRPMLTAGWTDPGDDTWWAIWPPTDHASHMVEKPTAVKEWNGTTLVTMAAATSQANCNATDASWFYDRAARRLYINPTGAALATKYWVEYPLRISTHDFPARTKVSVTESSEAVQFYGVMHTKPSFTRSIELLQGLASVGGGNLSIADNLGQFNFADRFSREEIYNAPITIKVGGGIAGKGEMDYANYITIAAGNVVNYSGQVEQGRFNLQYIDATSPYSATVAANTDFFGVPSDIIASACAAASPVVTAPTEATGLDTARPYWCALSRQEKVRVLDVIAACCQHLMMFYVKRGGTPTLDWWKAPDAGETLGGTFRQAEAININRELAEPYSTINVSGGQGIMGARRVISAKGDRTATRNRSDNFQREQITYTSGWTVHATASNVAFRAWDIGEIEEIEENGAILLKAGSISACDGDNLSWFQGHDDSVASGNPNRLYINPSGAASSANGKTYIVRYKKEKVRTAETGASYADTNFKTATSAELKAVRSKDRVLEIHSLITKATHLQSFADDALALAKFPFEVMVFSAPLTDALSVELNQTIKWQDSALAATYWRVMGLADDLQQNRCTIRCWRQSLASAIV